MKKIVIIGNTGSGKTMLANKLGELLDIPVHHLDKIFWVQKGGIKQEEFITKQEQIMKEDSWIIDGSFVRSKSLDIRFSNADTIIILEFSRRLIYWRYFKRSLKYFNKVRPDMGGTNKRHLHWNSIKYIWNYPVEMVRSKVLEYSKIKNVIILHNTKEEELFFKNIIR